MLEFESSLESPYAQSPKHWRKKKKLSACRGEGSVVGPLLAVLRCRCAALLVLVLMSTLAMPN